MGDPEIERLAMLMERNRECLERELDDRRKEIFRKYMDCADEYACLISSQAFQDGFSLASRFMAEALL